MDRQASLCWGQRHVWLNHHQLPPRERHELNLIISIGPEPGSTIDSLRQVFDLLVRRHEGLRSTHHIDRDGGPVQRVHPPRGRMPVACYDTTEHTPAELAALIAEFTAAEFVLDRDWPIRACIISTGSAPQRVIVVGHHTALDDWVMETLKREADELHAGILSRRPAALAPVRYHPVDLARYEASGEAARIHQRSREHWDRGLRDIPADLFAARRSSGPQNRPGFSASLSSPAALSAARTLATRHGVFPSVVYHAVFTALLAAYTHSPMIGYRVFAGNRRSPRHADVLTCMFQPTLMCVDGSDNPSFTQLVRRGSTASAAALDNSYAAYDEILETVSRHSTERGMGIRLGTTFNHLRYPGKVRGGSRTVLTRNATPRAWSYLDEDCYLRVSEWRDCVVATLTASSAVISEDDLARFLRGFETLLTAAAGSDAELRVRDVAGLVGFDPAAPTPDAVLVDHTLVDLNQVTECLNRCPGVRLAKVFAQHSPTGGHLLTAYVVATDPALHPGALRNHLLGLMYDVPRVCCPHQFVICEREPADPNDQHAWAGQPARVAGDGTTPFHCPPSTDEERLLGEAVESVNRTDRVSMADSYVVAGGRVLNIPRVQQVLRDKGYRTPSVYQIASGRPLRAIAAMLRRMDDVDREGEPNVG